MKNPWEEIELSDYENHMKSDSVMQLQSADMIAADLLIEYIGYPCFQNVIVKVKPQYISCIIQINTNHSFVSDSPWLHAFDKLDKVHHQMQEDELIILMKDMNYGLIDKIEESLPNGKKLVQLDFELYSLG